MDKADKVDVLIAGAGPTGLVLALWLARQGIKVKIVDKAAQPGTTSRAMVVQARTLEFYRQLGFADETIAAGKRNVTVNLWIKGKRRAHLSLQDAGARLTPYPFILVYPQDRHETLLLQQLAKAGVQVERPVELVGFEDREDDVVARLRDADGTERTCQARFLAGCDGARSAVREQLGTGFPGGTYEHVFYVADVEANGAAADGEVHVAIETSDFVIMLPYTDTGRGRLIGTVREDHDRRAGAWTFDDVGHRALDSLGMRVDAVHWFSTYRVHHRVTNHYRSGQVFLVGDAAHVHSPVGGQGMNTGIGDAVNLAWKLAAVVRHEAPDSLLDSYETERLAFARKLVDTTDRLFNFVTAEGNIADFVRTRIAPLFASAAYSIDAVRELIFRIISQITIDYHHSSLSVGSAGAIKAGDRLPWVRIGDEGDEPDNHAPREHIDWQVQVYGTAGDGLRAWCLLHGMPLREIAWHPRHEEAGFARNAHYLVRPDGHVAVCDPSFGPDAVANYFRDRAYRRFCSG